MTGIAVETDSDGFATRCDEAERSDPWRQA